MSKYHVINSLVWVAGRGGAQNIHWEELGGCPLRLMSVLPSVSSPICPLGKTSVCENSVSHRSGYATAATARLLSLLTRMWSVFLTTPTRMWSVSLATPTRVWSVRHSCIKPQRYKSGVRYKRLAILSLINLAKFWSQPWMFRMPEQWAPTHTS